MTSAVAVLPFGVLLAPDPSFLPGPAQYVAAKPRNSAASLRPQTRVESEKTSSACISVISISARSSRRFHAAATRSTSLAATCNSPAPRARRKATNTERTSTRSGDAALFGLSTCSATSGIPTCTGDSDFCTFATVESSTSASKW